MRINFSFCEEEEGEEGGSTKIVGGDLITISEVPYFGSIFYKNRHLCGSSLISNQWVLSAAHCYIDGYSPNYQIRTSSSMKSQGGILNKVQRIIKHPLYNGSSLNYDFMLIKLSQPIRFSAKQKAIKLPKKGKIVPEGTDVRTSGFGLTQNVLESDQFLRSVVVQVSNHQYCSRAYSGYITDQMVRKVFEIFLNFF